MADAGVLLSLSRLYSESRSDFFLSTVDGCRDSAEGGNTKQRQREEEKRIHELVYALCEGEAGGLVTSESVWQSALFACRRFGSMPAHTRDQFVEAISSNLSVLCAAISARYSICDIFV